MHDVSELPLYPSEVVTISILFALKGCHSRAFCHWFKRDYATLVSRQYDRTTLQRQLCQQQYHGDRLLPDASLLNVIDNFPIELLFLIHKRRAQQKLGK